MLNSFKLKLSVCICTHSVLTKLKKNCCLKSLLSSYSWIVTTYFFNSSLKSIEVDDLIVNEKKVKKEEDKEMNTSLCVKFQDAHCFFKYKTQIKIAKTSF